MNRLSKCISVLVILFVGTDVHAQTDKDCIEKVKSKTESVLNLKNQSGAITYMKMTTVTTSANDLLSDANETAEYLFNDKTMIMTSNHVDMLVDEKNVYSILHEDKMIYRSAPSKEELDLQKMATAGRDSIISTATIEGCSCVHKNFMDCTIEILPSSEWSSQLGVDKIEMTFNEKGVFSSYKYYYKQGAPNSTVEITIEELIEDYDYKGEFTVVGFISKNAKKYEGYEKI